MNDSAPTHRYSQASAGPTAAGPTVPGDTVEFGIDPTLLGSVLPERISRYRVERVLGTGGFGIVYLAHDDLLHRPVAIKVPHPPLLHREEAEVYLAEARAGANLDHPNLVAVYDVGSEAAFPCYIVSKYVDGCDLAERLRSSPPPLGEAVGIVALVADALHYAHQHGLVHRDVKPSNILLDRQGKPFVADFGLALREQDRDRGWVYAGTPPYMSPEQARGEGHRVDGRSDVFSLGVVLYELLTGQRPFRGQTSEEVLDRICTVEACPPRQINEAIPEQLERVCLKALAKRAADRYATARDMAEDLRQSLGEAPAADAQPEAAPADGSGSTAEFHPVAVVPKGLRAFDTEDANFFLDLLPGPRDRHGLPEAVRFWKVRIEQTDPDRTFPVGLLCGPSGCGKSSLVKAGLLPRLEHHVRPLYVEATAGVERRLLYRLRRACPEAATATTLPLAAAAIRRGRPGEKVLIVLDQFEQWLHARRDGEGGELVRALRQCDGGHLQCLLLVRDDFWMMATRFMRELEVPVAEGHNSAAVDLFDLAHARKVLAAFGRAYGALPAQSRDLGAAQAAFLERATAELAQDGRVVPLRLALFADMVKRRPWVVKLLSDLGGVVGIGVTYLDESFMAAAAPPEHRYHQNAVRAALSALLPPAGTDIKGHTRSRRELLEASGYAGRPVEFDGLMRILIGETRLLTPVAAESAGHDSSSKAVPASEQHYQLTHDYLVPSVRDWLTRKRMETRRGRAELRLSERAALWRAKPEVRQLPSLTEWLTIRLLTRRRTWSESERQMMRVASRRHLRGLARAAVAAALIAAAALLFRGHLAEERAAVRAEGLVRHLLDADMAEVPGLVDQLKEYRPWADPALAQVLADPGSGRAHQLRARLGLLPADSRQADELQERLLEADQNEFPVIREALVPYRSDVAGRYWEVLASEREDPGRRFRAAAALATYEPADPRWEKNALWVAEQLVSQPALVRNQWVSALRPVKERLTPPLSALVRDRSRTPVAASAAEILGDYAADRPDVLAEALGFAAPDSFAHLFPRLVRCPDRLSALDAAFAAAAGQAQSPGAAVRQANLAIALLRVGAGERLWPLLKASPEPQVRSYIIDRFAILGCDPEALIARLGAEPDDTARAALWLGLGGFDSRALPAARRAELTAAAGRAYCEDDSAAVHAAAWWLLGRWEARFSSGREALARKGWYVNGIGQTMVHVAGPVTFLMGSPPNEPGYRYVENRHEARINYSFDISMTEVTVGQYRRFLESRAGCARLKPADADKPAEVPVTKITWYEAAAFCNWLSEAEGIPRKQWCYAPNPQGEYAEGMKLVPDYERLGGYRLPTEREWEFACRGGAVTRRCYGDADELLPQYAWFAGNAGDDCSPVALLLPNAYGLFDMHGNSSEWCQDSFSFRPYDGRPGANLGTGPILNSGYRISRGGHIFAHAKTLRSAKRYADRPNTEDAGGFRVARSRPD